MADHTVTTTDLRRKQLPHAMIRGEHVSVTHWREPIAVIVPTDWYQAVTVLLDQLVLEPNLRAELRRRCNALAVAASTDLNA